jgi:hypothetical protein
MPSLRQVRTVSRCGSLCHTNKFSMIWLHSMCFLFFKTTAWAHLVRLALQFGILMPPRHSACSGSRSYYSSVWSPRGSAHSGSRSFHLSVGLRSKSPRGSAHSGSRSFCLVGRGPPLDKILDPFTHLLDQWLTRNGIRLARAQDPIVRRLGRDLGRHIHQLGQVW